MKHEDAGAEQASFTIEALAEIFVRGVNAELAVNREKYGADHDQCERETEIILDESDAVLGRIILKNRIAREQYDRNRDIDRLGDLSDYYGQPTLAEIYENDMEMVLDDSESSDYSESDFE